MSKRGIFTPYSLIDHLLQFEYGYSVPETIESKYLTRLEHAHTILMLARADYLVGLASYLYLKSRGQDFEELLAAGGAANDNGVRFGYPNVSKRRSPILSLAEIEEVVSDIWRTHGYDRDANCHSTEVSTRDNQSASKSELTAPPHPSPAPA